jgi:hypothetical protein
MAIRDIAAKCSAVPNLRVGICSEVSRMIGHFVVSSSEPISSCWVASVPMTTASGSLEFPSAH